MPSKPEKIATGWKASIDLSLHQAALLLADIDPSTVTTGDTDNLPPDYQPYLEMFISAVVKGELIGDVRLNDRVPKHKMPDMRTDGDPYRHEEVDPYRTRVDLISIKSLLIRRGIKSTFFGNASTNDQAFLDPSDECYSDHLAIAIKAWKAVANNKRLVKKTVKQALEEWLITHHSDLSNEARERIATVANWKRGGPANSG